MPNPSYNHVYYGASRSHTCPHVLLIGDVPADTAVLQDILHDRQPSCQVHVLATGTEALQWLRSPNAVSQMPAPHLIVLNWAAVPEKADAILTGIKSHSELQMVPVIVLSSSQLDEQATAGYDLYVNCWVNKGNGAADQALRFRTMVSFWFETAELPRHGSQARHSFQART